MKAGGIIFLVFAGLTVYWVVAGKTVLTPQPLPDPGGPGTPSTPVKTGPSGIAPGGAPSTLNGPAPGSALFNQLFPPSQT